MDLMKENQPASTDAAWKKQDVGGLELLLKAAQRTDLASKETGVRKSKEPSMVLNGSYKTPVIVGRGSQATLNLGRINKQVSRRHAVVQWCHVSSAFLITVLGQNGVRINGTGYPSGQQAMLQDGDIVDLVGVKMLFRTPAGSPPSLPPGRCSSPSEKFLESGLLYGDDLESISVAVPAGLETPPKRTHNTTSAHQQFSSPIGHDMSPPPLSSSPSSHLTHPTSARMRYNMHMASSSNRSHYDSPPPSSDAGTEFGSSPFKSRPIFTMPHDASPVRRPLLGLESPKSEDHHHIFLDDNDNDDADDDDDDEPPPSPTKFSGQRTPLAPLSLVENNGQSNNTLIFQLAATSATGRAAAATAAESSTPALPMTKAQSKPTKTQKSSSASTKSVTGGAKDTKPKSTLTVKENDNKASSATVFNQEKNKPTKDSHRQLVVEPLKVTTPKGTKVGKATTLQSATPSQSSSSSSSSTVKDHVHTMNAGDDASSKARPSSQRAKDSLPQEKGKVDNGNSHNKVDDSSLSSRESPLDAPAEKSAMDYTEMIIDTLVFARKKKSMTLSELFDDMIASQPSLTETQKPEEIKEQMLQCLSAARCVGKITRRGKDANNKPLENQWYYIPECDHNVMRKLTRQEVMPSARKCTLKDKQYFFKMPPKLPYHRKSTSPYAVKPSARRTKESSRLSAGADENEAESSSSPSSSEAEEEADKPLQAKRKRKAVVSGYADKMHKSKLTSSAKVGYRKNNDMPHNKDDNRKVEEKEEQDDDDEDDDDGQNDSLDDISELSGLSD
ncbi:hypothetical protein BGZ65_000078 [Modicella reniformis]|uniref:FHA domain-containing protein n=1 Tax=Modicella reniformis TaxID=1440133 RepID=A0A9P6INY0_9FUNG|nr:hypothetical protein BGZ65_000078 [Modicella reniformis]